MSRKSRSDASTSPNRPHSAPSTPWPNNSRAIDNNSIDDQLGSNLNPSTHTLSSDPNTHQTFNQASDDERRYLDSALPHHTHHLKQPNVLRKRSMPARSHFVRRVEGETRSMDYGVSMTSDEVRKQTLSWTYRELELGLESELPHTSSGIRTLNKEVTETARPNSVFDPVIPVKPPTTSLLHFEDNDFRNGTSPLNDMNESTCSFDSTSDSPHVQWSSNVNLSNASPSFASRPPFDREITVDEESALLGTHDNSHHFETTQRLLSYKGFASLFSLHLMQDIAITGIRAVPAVILAVILNLLDAMSYGIIIFPASDEVFPPSATSAGISMFYVSTVISQLIYTFGGSAFKGAVGSMMIEVMPFLHVMCDTIEQKMKGSPDSHIIATVVVAYALSSILTGLVFLTLGVLKLGNMIQFFPRHTLIGCIGGIGLFLCLTGIEVTAGIAPDIDFAYFQRIFELHAFKLWGISLLLAVLLKFLQSRIQHTLLVPLFYLIIPMVFYIIVFSVGISFDDLRAGRWLFNVPSESNLPFWGFWGYYNFSVVDWNAVAATFPTQLALAFFGILHVPINVPALSVSTRQDVDLTREIIGHGLSNIVSGFSGSIQNYLVYSNSLLYIRTGGNSRTAGVMLAAATALLWIKGGEVVSFVPTIVIGSLIFHLGIDLMKESLVDTWHVMKPLEYLTIILIVVVMSVFGFTEGIILGIVLACVFFVFTYSRKTVIRDSFTGCQLRSTVHRLYRQQTFLDKVGEQIQIIKLQGFIFFGTLNQLEAHVKDLLEQAPKTRFIVMDFSLIHGIDYSASESFLRIRRLVSGRRIHLIFSGLRSIRDDVARSGLLDVEDDEDVSQSPFVHCFDTINDSLEWCENYLLKSYYTRIQRTVPVPSIKSENGSGSTPFLTPRHQQVEIAASLVENEHPHPKLDVVTFHPENIQFSRAAALLMQAFPEASVGDTDLVRALGGLFERHTYLDQQVIYQKGDEADGIYLIEEGQLVLKTGSSVIETLVPGTMVGELETFSGHPRPCALVAHSDSIVWKLPLSVFETIKEKEPALALAFITKIAISFDSARLYNYIYHWTQLG